MAVYTVSQVTRYIKESLERDALLADLWVSGEVSNYTRSSAGHSYFSLKEANTVLRCVMFRGGSGHEHLGSGAAVSAHGRISVYEARGDLQCIVDLARPEGMGERYLELERLLVKLESEGLFEPSRKRPLPAFPQRLGVITSPTGAVWHDIQTVVERRYPLAELALAPCLVQGDTAAPSIIEAFEVINAEPGIDAVILARGGGSTEDLWVFNEEPVARAVYGSRTPVISAVGHETNTTVADMVADVRAPTPSAAAELAVPDSRILAARVAQNGQTLYQGVQQELALRMADVRDCLSVIERRVPDTASRRQQVDDLLAGLVMRLENSLAMHRQRTTGLDQRLSALDPAGVLRRGYAVVSREDTGETLLDAADVAAGDVVRVRLHRGGFGARVEGDGQTKQ
ncbi:MAG: exodeoxyribonuclease VII large subunit [Chloroflexi bacterium]|nr:exodeoxyribonuclease VII large subunit [Chloroflexota bacterium]